MRPTAQTAIGQTAAEKKEIYDKGMVGRVQLVIPKGEGDNEFTGVMRRVKALQDKWGLKTNTDLFLWMLEQVERPSAARGVLDNG